MSEVILKCIVAHSDGGFSAVRNAPKLPPGVCWQAGMYFRDDPNADEDLQIDWIVVTPDGTVQVVFLLEYASPVSDESKDMFRSSGWTIEK